MMRIVNLVNCLPVLLLTSWQCCLWSALADNKSSQAVSHTDGSDQRARCFQSEVVCALEAEADKFLEWTWFVADDVKTRPDLDGATRLLLEGSMRLNLGKSIFNMAHDELRTNLKQLHKAKIYFPFWPPTDNESCQFSLLYRVNDRSLFVAGASDQKSTNDRKYPWPKVSVVLIKPKIKQKHTNESNEETTSLAEVHLLDSLEHPISYLSNEFEAVMLIGKQMTGSWTLAILVETKLDANLFELTNLKLTNCEPMGDEMDEFMHKDLVALVDLKSAFKESCNDADEQFQCRLSGRCISLDYRCDFGRDCGPNDDSDEFRCPADFEGRCDFEDATLCQWIPMPRGEGNSWLWTETEIDYDEQNPANSSPTDGHNRPRVDHTHQSRQTPGHYLLLGAHQIDKFHSAQLIGPRVQLKANHKECKFRFWVQTPDKLKGSCMKSARLTVGYERVEAMELFDEAMGKQRHKENNWRRFQVTLFNRSTIFHNISIYALHLTFGNLLKDLEIFALASGFVAIDDFSFSSGCALSFYDKPPATICGDTEFQCEFAPPQTPNQFCIPSNRVCDFKNDCGTNSELSSSGWSSGAASDEAFCMHWFDVDRSLAFVGLETSGVQLINYKLANGGESSAFKFTETVNEAFRMDLPLLVLNGDRSPPKLQPFIIQTQYETFTSNFQSMSGKAMRHVRDIGILLPRFHQAHSNCRLILTYDWAMNTKNLLASIYVIRSGVSSLYKRWSSTKDLSLQNGTSFEISLGIGEQNSPFNVYLKISIESFELDGNSDRDSPPFSGSFSLTKYNFENCAHQSGIVNIAQAESVPIGDDEDDEYEDEYRHESLEAESRASKLRLNCPETQFQCGQPILCLDQKLVCDMQRDCQESGADELDCASKGSIQFDFEHSNCKQFEGWRPVLMDRAGNRTTIDWSVIRVNHKLRAEHDIGPPVDHTLGRASGSFLSLGNSESIAEAFSGIGIDMQSRSESASIHTPRFRVLETCRRLVLYVYDKRKTRDGDESIAYRFSAEYYRSNGATSEEVIFATTKPVGKPDGWLRLEFELPHVQADCSSCRNASEFSIGLHGTVLVDPTRGTPMLAIDDLTLGPKCELAIEPIDASTHRQISEPGDHTGWHRWFWIVIAFLAVSFSLLAIFVYLNKIRPIRPINYARQGHGDNLALDDFQRD